jgi:hypothetical protein
MKWLWTYYLLTSLSILSAQNYRIFEADLDNIAYGVLSLKDGYILLVRNSCDSLCNSLYKIGKNNEIIYKKEISALNGQVFYSKNPNCEFLYCAFEKRNNKFHTRLLEFDYTGNIKNDLVFENANTSILGFKVVDDGTGYIFNTIKRPISNKVDSVYIFKSNYTGSILWSATYLPEDSANYLALYDTDITLFSQDQVSVVGKYIYVDKNSPFPNEKSFLVRFSTSGQFFYKDYYPEIRRHLFGFKSDPYQVTNLIHMTCGNGKDGFSVTSFIDTIISIPGKEWASRHALIINLDENNQVINHSIIENYIDALFPLDIQKTNNNDILYLDYAGDPVFYPNYDPGFRISRIDPQGKIKWQRTYVSPFYYYQDSTPQGLFQFEKMTELANGSIMVVGSYLNYRKELQDFDQDAFVMLLDSSGCLNHNCEIYTNIFQLTPVNVSNNYSELEKISYGSNGSNLIISSSTPLAKVTLRVFNLHGFLINRSDFTLFTSEIIDLNSMPKGVYFVHIIIDSKHYKIIKILN